MRETQQPKETGPNSEPCQRTLGVTIEPRSLMPFSEVGDLFGHQQAAIAAMPIQQSPDGGGFGGAPPGQDDLQDNHNRQHPCQTPPHKTSRGVLKATRKTRVSVPQIKIQNGTQGQRVFYNEEGGYLASESPNRLVVS